MNRGTTRAWALALALNTGIILAFRLSVTPLSPGDPMWPASDHINYIAMWQDLAGEHFPPFCYRLLQPALAAALPFDYPAAFAAVTLFMLVGTGFLLFSWLLGLGASTRLALAGVVLFHGLNWCTKYLVYDVYRPEPALFFFTMLALVFHSRGKWWAAGIALAVAGVAKESALFVVPWLVLDRWRGPREGRARDTLTLAMPAMMTFAVLRFAVTPASAYDPLESLRVVAPERLSSGLPSFLRGLTLGTWGVLVPLAMAFAPRHAWKRFTPAIPFVVLVAIQPLVATNVDRLVTFAFPVTVALAVFGLARIEEKLAAGTATAMVLACVPLALVLIKSSWQSPAPEQRLLFLALALGTLYGVRRWRKPRLV